MVLREIFGKGFVEKLSEDYDYGEDKIPPNVSVQKKGTKSEYVYIVCRGVF